MKILDALTAMLEPLPVEQTSKPYLEWLHEDCGYIAPMPIGDKHWVAVERLIFHGSLIGGDMGDYVNVRWRYCYDDVPSALAAMLDWIAGGCEGEPTDWNKRRSAPMSISPGV